MGGTESHLRSEKSWDGRWGWAVAVGESSLRIEQVVLQREWAAFAAARAAVTGCWRRPQPPGLLAVLSALRSSRRVAATVTGGAGGRVAEGRGLALPGPGAETRLASGAGGKREQRRAGCLADTCLASPSTREVQRQAESEGAGARGGLTRGRTPTGLEMLVAPPIGNQTGRDWPRRARARGRAGAARHYHAPRSRLQAPTLLTC